MSSPTTARTIVVLGSGPGIGITVASLFVANGFDNLALVSRNATRLEQEVKTVQAQVGTRANVAAFPADLGDTASVRAALAKIEAAFGAPEVVVYNASRMSMGDFDDYDEERMIADYRVDNTGLFTTAMWALPLMTESAKGRATTDPHPALLATNGALVRDPRPVYFSLSMVKAAQLSMMTSLAKKYEPEGVHVASVIVNGPVRPDTARTAEVVAAEYWKLYVQGREEWARDVTTV